MKIIFHHIKVFYENYLKKMEVMVEGMEEMNMN